MTENAAPLSPMMTFTGLLTDAHTARMSSAFVSPGA